MTSTNSATSTNPFASITPPPPAAASPSSGIDQAGFLKLLTTQMTQQDPTAPMDTATMVQQLTEMSTVSGITEMNQSLKDMTTELTGNRIGDAASWIGKKALVESSTAQPLADGSFSGEIALTSDASSMSLSLVDANGNAVYSKTYNGQKAGVVDFSWDGKLPDGTAAAGPLKVVVSATTSTGQTTPATAVWATVTGVQSPAGGSAAQISTSLGTVAPTDVLSLS
jgi:flagellar basal-body rod modification protein FlgD